MIAMIRMKKKLVLLGDSEGFCDYKGLCVCNCDCKALCDNERLRLIVTEAVS